MEVELVKLMYWTGVLLGLFLGFLLRGIHDRFIEKIEEAFRDGLEKEDKKKGFRF